MSLMERNGDGRREAKRAVGERSEAAAGPPAPAAAPDPELVERPRRRRFSAEYVAMTARIRRSLTGTPRLWRAAMPPVRANRVSGRAAEKLRRNTNTGPAVWQPSAYGRSPPGAEAGAAGATSVERPPIS